MTPQIALLLLVFDKSVLHMTIARRCSLARFSIRGIFFYWSTVFEKISLSPVSNFFFKTVFRSKVMSGLSGCWSPLSLLPFWFRFWRQKTEKGELGPICDSAMRSIIKHSCFTPTWRSSVFVLKLTPFFRDTFDQRLTQKDKNMAWNILRGKILSQEDGLAFLQSLVSNFFVA